MTFAVAAEAGTAAKPRFPSIKRSFIAATAALMLAGCGAEPGFLAVAGATSTIVNTDKLPTDFIAEAVTGLDCNSIRQSRDKGPLCRAPEQRVIERPVYCYRTLGDMNCYEQPDPFGDGAQQVN